MTVPGASNPRHFMRGYGPQWIFTRLDGRAWLHDAAWNSIAAGRLGQRYRRYRNMRPRSLLLATRPGDGSEKDAIRVLSRSWTARRRKRPRRIDMPGPVTALWPIDESSAVAVARDLASGEYAAYRLAISCSH